VTPIEAEHLRRALQQDYERDKLMVGLITSLTKKQKMIFIESLTKKQKKELLSVLARVKRS
jgi:hypothetical protein